MRRKGRLPLKRKYFHTKRKIDNKDISILKKKIEKINKTRKKDKKEKQNFWKF
jgi:hypothetical protein